MAGVTIFSDFGAPKIMSVTVSTVSPSICHKVMGPDAMILVFWMPSYTLNTCNDRTLWWQPGRLCPSSASVTSPATPWGQSPTLWSIRLCNRLIHLYVHVKASRTDNHLFSRKERGTVTSQCGYISRTLEWSEHGSKVNHMYVLVSQNNTEIMFTLQLPIQGIIALCLRKQCTDLNLKTMHC